MSLSLSLASYSGTSIKESSELSFHSQQVHLNTFLPLKKENLCITSKKFGPKVSVTERYIVLWAGTHPLLYHMRSHKLTIALELL